MTGRPRTVWPAMAQADRPETVLDELLEEIRHGITNQPRSLQRRIGPSEIGDPCPKALLHKLNGDEETDRGVAWKAWVGTGIHAMLEQTFTNPDAVGQNPDRDGGPRYLLEQRVTVGHVDGQPVTGSCDLFDRESGTIVDWKALAINELVATPDGWTEIGLLRIGDLVLGRDFQPHRVIGINDFPEQRPLFDVAFNDGTSVRATADHLWTVSTRNGALVTVRTDELRIGSEGHRLPAITPVDDQDTPLLLHPYALGVWLGDGGKRTASRSDRRSAPEQYLRASRLQRADLLAGLMDTDGGISTTGSTLFYTTSKVLAGQVADLARSLGGWAKVWTKPSRNYYVRAGARTYTSTTEYRVALRVPLNPFQHNEDNRAHWELLHVNGPGRKDWRRIVKSVTPAGISRVRCIAVDAPDELFLTRDLIVTHNTKGKHTMGGHRRHGPGQTYRTQAHLYGQGWVNAGHRVQTVMIVFLPRDGEFGQIFQWSEPFQPAIAEQAMARLNSLNQLLRLGIEQATAMYPEPCGQDYCSWCPKADPRPPYGEASKTLATSTADLIRSA